MVATQILNCQPDTVQANKVSCIMLAYSGLMNGFGEIDYNVDTRICPAVHIFGEMFFISTRIDVKHVYY